MHAFIDDIIHNTTHCYFISPNFGDAASSCGELIDYLQDKIQITVINIFTQSGEPPYTLSAKRYLHHYNTKESKQLYAERMQEDLTALSLFPVAVKNMSFKDALWRKKHKASSFGAVVPEMTHLYPTYTQILSGNIAQEDQVLKKQIKETVQEIIPTGQNVRVFCPIGFFNHVDYLLIRDVCWELFGAQCIFYALPIDDITHPGKSNFIKKHALTPYAFSISSEKKLQVVKAYEKESASFFAQKSLVCTPETYYTQQIIAKKDYTITVHKTLATALLQQWQAAWETSPLKNFCNSPLWFQAATQTFTYQEILILTCYDKDTLVAVLPLVSHKQYGIPTYMTPGNQYYDNSSLLLTQNNPQIVVALLEKLKTLGNFYLSESGKIVATITSTYMPEVSITSRTASFSPYFLMQPDPYRFITKKNKRILAKKFKDAGEDFSYAFYHEDAGKHLQTLINIDTESRKKEALKDTFGDTHLGKLLTTINLLDKKTLFIALLFYKQEPICYNFGIIYGNTFMSLGTAYKDAWNKFSPGRVLVYKLLPEIMHRGLTMWDFSRGISRFKKDFTPYFYQQYTLSYTKNSATAMRWKALHNTKTYLEEHPIVFEALRKTKKMILR